MFLRLNETITLLSYLGSKRNLMRDDNGLWFLTGQVGVPSDLKYREALTWHIHQAKALLAKLIDVDFRVRDNARINAVLKAIKFWEGKVNEMSQLEMVSVESIEQIKSGDIVFDGTDYLEVLSIDSGKEELTVKGSQEEEILLFEDVVYKVGKAPRNEPKQDLDELRLQMYTAKSLALSQAMERSPDYREGLLLGLKLGALEARVK